MLNDFSMDLGERRIVLMKNLQELADSSKSNQLVKQALVTVQSVFVPTDDKELLARLRDAYKKVKAPASGLPTPSYIGIMLKYFVANLLLRQGQVEEAAKSAKELLKEIRGYFGHDMSELSLDPALILLHQRFEAFTSVDPATMQTAEQQQRLQAQQVEILAAAEELEKKTLQLQGDKSERLVEVYCLYSFFELQGGNFEGGMELQRKATRISLQASGAENPQYIQRLHEQVTMVVNSGRADALPGAVKEAEEAARLAAAVYCKPEDEAQRLPILRTLCDCLLGTGENARALEVMKEYLALLRKVRAAQPLEQGAVDGELARALFALHDIEAQCGNKQGAVDAFNECEAVMDKCGADEPDLGLARLKHVITTLKPAVVEQQEKIRAALEVEKSERARKELQEKLEKE